MQKAGLPPSSGVPAGIGSSLAVVHPSTPGGGSALVTASHPTFIRTASRPPHGAAAGQATTTSRAATPPGGTPRPTIPRPGASRVSTPAPVGTPVTAPIISASVTPLPAPVRATVSATTLPATSTGPPARPAHPLPARPVGAPIDPSPARGVKRERDDSGALHKQDALQSQSLIGSSTVNGTGGVRPGMPGAKPRPVKKQRMDSHGLAREMPIQQPTPQGV